MIGKNKRKSYAWRKICASTVMVRVNFRDWYAFLCLVILSIFLELKKKFKEYALPCKKCDGFMNKFAALLLLTIFILKNFTDVQFTCSVMLISATQQSDSLMCINIYVLFPYGLIQGTEYNSLCCTIGPCSFILYIQVCIC